MRGESRFGLISPDEVGLSTLSTVTFHWHADTFIGSLHHQVFAPVSCCWDTFGSVLSDSSESCSLCINIKCSHRGSKTSLLLDMPVIGQHAFMIKGLQPETEAGQWNPIITRTSTVVTELTKQPWGVRVCDAVLGGLEDWLGQRDGVTNHGSIQAVFCHHAAAAPALLPFPPLGSAVLKPHLQMKVREGFHYIYIQLVSVMFVFFCSLAP